MARRPIDSSLGRFASIILILLGLVSCFTVYVFLSLSFRPTITRTLYDSGRESLVDGEDEGEGEGGCCRGIDHLELWGDAVKWGADFKVRSAKECCEACKGICNGGRECLCDSWVFCGDRQACGDKFGECWLKKQKDSLEPDRADLGDKVMWTSGLIFGKEEGIVGLETSYGIMRVELFPDCAPYSVAYILELLSSHHCPGCQFYRAESRGDFWDSRGNHYKNVLDKVTSPCYCEKRMRFIVGVNPVWVDLDCCMGICPAPPCVEAPFGPPFALIQGTLEASETLFKNIPKENCPNIRRGSIAWVGSGPDFFISLANHNEWRNTYTVFGSVLQEDMEIAEKIAQLPTRQDIWNSVNVAVLENPISLRFRRIKSFTGTMKI